MVKIVVYLVDKGKMQTKPNQKGSEVESIGMYLNAKV